MADTTDLVGTWNVPMSDKSYKIEFYHGTTTGKRIIKINGREILRREWMFKLVGREIFELSNVRCAITIEAIGIFAYEYSLEVGGKAFEKFRDQQNKCLQVWHLSGNVGIPTSTKDDSKEKYESGDARICLEKETMDVWVNGTKANTTGEFLENGGTKTHFEVGQNQLAYIESESSGKRSIGLIYKLYVNGNFISPIS